MDPDRRTGVACAAGGMAVLSTEAVLLRLADVSALDAVFWIGCCTVVVAVSWLVLVERARPAALWRAGGPPLLAAGLFQGGTTTLFVVAVSTTSVANVVVLLAGAPLAAAVIAWLVLGERVGAPVALGLAAGVAGSAIVVTGTAGTGGRLAGDLAALGAVLCFGAATTVLRRHPLLSRPAVVGLGGLVMVAAGAPAAAVPSRGWVLLIVVGAVTSPAARLLLALAPRHLPAAQVGLFVPVETVLASLWAWLLLDEAPPGATWLGAAVIVSGLAVAVLGEGRHTGGGALNPAGVVATRRRARAGTNRPGDATPGRSAARPRRRGHGADRVRPRRG